MDTASLALCNLVTAVHAQLKLMIMYIPRCHRTIHNLETPINTIDIILIFNRISHGMG